MAFISLTAQNKYQWMKDPGMPSIKNLHVYDF